MRTEIRVSAIVKGVRTMQAQLRCRYCGALFKVERDDVLNTRKKGACPNCGFELDAETTAQLKKAFDSIAQLVEEKFCKEK